MEDVNISHAGAAHAARLDRTIKELQSRVKEQEAALEKLRTSTRQIPTELSPEPVNQLQQLRLLITAYESLTPSEPYLPSTDSPLPSLLALRITHKTIQETKSTLQNTYHDFTEIERRLEKEQADLEDANLIGKGLENRIETLRGEIQERTQKSPSQVARELIRELKKKKTNYDSETGMMVRAFNKFVDSHLAVMLAAEELGGPVVGEMLDVEELDLESGFNNQGKAKRLKGGKNEVDRQRRIDEIWGSNTVENGRNTEPRDEKRAAAAEMRELTEQLLNSLVEADVSDGDAYVDLPEESAVARFLVRAKVAQFHPKDATRVRLIDFGRDLDE